MVLMLFGADYFMCVWRRLKPIYHCDHLSGKETADYFPSRFFLFRTIGFCIRPRNCTARQSWPIGQAFGEYSTINPAFIGL